jgi:hypothetical protein
VEDEVMNEATVEERMRWALTASKDAETAARVRPY